MPDLSFVAYLIVVAAFVVGAAVADWSHRMTERRRLARFEEFRMTPGQLERLRRRVERDATPEQDA